MKITLTVLGIQEARIKGARREGQRASSVKLPVSEFSLTQGSWFTLFMLIFPVFIRETFK